jgi:NAD(P)-dependent dehydrogenase (short-subunit alcohol dehydrogenase family)
VIGRIHSHGMGPTIVFISGANRGLGKGLLELYLAKPNHIVIAANRDPSNPTCKEFLSLLTGSRSRLIVIKVDASIESDPFRQLSNSRHKELPI